MRENLLSGGKSFVPRVFGHDSMLKPLVLKLGLESKPISRIDLGRVPE